MRILVVGMGLIGGSICKSIKAATSHAVYGCDIQPKVLEDAAADGAIDGAGTMTDGTYDMIILCLHHRRRCLRSRQGRSWWTPAA